jgi:C-terminal processing protease CtpA/Prc
LGEDPSLPSPTQGYIGVSIAGTGGPETGQDFRQVLSVIPRSAADVAGIVAGDYIVAVNGKATAEMKTGAELLAVLRGAAGTVVLLDLKRLQTGKVETIPIIRTKSFWAREVEE